MASSKLPLAILSTLVLLSCTSIDSRYGSLHDQQFHPSAGLRACTKDDECVAADVDCDSCCPGGGGVNVKSLMLYKQHREKACAKHKTPPRSDCTCAMARVRCLNRLCTWDYQGPDPNSL